MDHRGLRAGAGGPVDVGKYQGVQSRWSSPCRCVRIQSFLFEPARTRVLAISHFLSCPPRADGEHGNEQNE